MENVTPEQKKPVIKSLALIGLVGIIILVAWLGVQIVQVLPSALTSLANLAGSVYNYNPAVTKDLKVSSSGTLINSGEPVTLSWTMPEVPGSYTFVYTCQEGITIALATKDKGISEVTCNTSYDVGLVDTLDLTIKSSQFRYADIAYTISFFRTNATKATAAHEGKLSVVNQDIAAVIIPNDTVIETPATTTATSSAPIVSATTTPVVIVPTPEAPKPASSTPAVTPTKPVPTKPVVTTKPVTVSTPTYIYKIPTSQANGTTDLAITYIGIGTVNSKNTFINSALLRKNTDGAIQFSVHNIGNKTSENWTFTAKLPGGVDYTSSTQTPLKPNERAVITVEFPGVKTSGIEKYSVTTKTTRDSNKNNNSFTATAAVYQ